MTIKKTILYGVILGSLLLIDWFVVNPGINALYDTSYGYNDYQFAVDIFTWQLLKYGLYSVFYVILIIEFKRDAQFVWFSLFGILSYIGFAGYYFFSTYFAFTSLHFRVTAGISTFGPSFMFLIASSIVLRDGYIKWITRPLILFAIIHIIYDSFFSFSILRYFITLYGPFREDVMRMLFWYNGIHYLLQVVMVVLQVVVLYNILFFNQVVVYKKQKESEHRMEEFNALS